MGRGEEDFARLHQSRTNELVQQIYAMYMQAITAIMKASARTRPKKGKPFTFEDFPEINKKVKQILADLATNTTQIIDKGTADAWDLADQKNDELVKRVFKNATPIALKERFLARNLQALEAFQKRKSDGMNLSDRVWKYTNSMQSDLEQALDIGILEGQSAAQMARDTKKYLNNPDALFRRVRDARGMLHLSKNAANYHPGQGVYRSAFKNAERLARTEINNAYRASDYDRWNRLDFVVGFEVKRSNRPFGCPRCEALKGKYPKTFKFSGWHPNCRCYVVSILATDEEVDKMSEMILNDEDISTFKSSRTIDTLPSQYVKYVNDNKASLTEGKSIPYWVRDNHSKDGKIHFDIKSPVAPINTGKNTVLNTKQSVLLKRIDEYEQEVGVTINKEIFSLADDVTFSRRDDGAYFDPDTNQVNIGISGRLNRSKWFGEAVVYHEFGHAVDAAHKLSASKQVKDLMAKYRAKLSEDDDMGYIKLNAAFNKELYMIDYAPKIDFSKREQLVSFADTLMSLNSGFGAGHTRRYFERPGNSEAEFIAHMFENKYIGNEVFKKIAPDLYKDMVKTANLIIKNIKATQSKKP